MIADGNYDNASGNLDINDLDVSFNEETFSDLDHYIHSDDFNTNNDFDKLNEAQKSYANNDSKHNYSVSNYILIYMFWDNRAKLLVS